MSSTAPARSDGLPAPSCGWRGALIGIGALLLAAALLYAHTLNVPFYLDDDSGIARNYPLRDLGATLESFFSQRGLTRLTFALNYRLTGWALPPLHLTNMALHSGCGLLVWLLLRRLVANRWLPLLGALLFVVHPLQTQAVTYLVQRSALLGTCFLLLAVLGWMRARRQLEAGHGRASVAYLVPYLGALLAGAAAVLSKENTATLPLVLLAHARLFPLAAGRDWRRDLGDCLPFCVAPALLAAGVFAGLAAGAEPQPLYYPLASLEHNAPLNYLATQFSVIWVYLRMLVLPYGQALEHDYPVVAELITLQSAAALAGLLLLAALVWRFRRRRPLLAFGTAWFFLGLAVESSVIPLDPLFEHRLYLPMVGFVLVLLDGLTPLFGERRCLLVLTLVILLCLPLTWRRNALWNDPIAFYQDNVQTVPDSERAMMELAFRYRDAGRLREAGELLERAVRLYPRNYEFHTALADYYAERRGLNSALAVLDEAIMRIPDNVELYETAALIAERYGQTPLIYAYLEKGLGKVTFGRWRLLNDLGIYHARDGNTAKAEEVYLQSLALYADNPAACQYLAALHVSQGRWPEAFALLKQAEAIEPGHPKTLEGLAKVARRLGDEATARRAEAQLRVAAAGEGGAP